MKFAKVFYFESFPLYGNHGNHGNQGLMLRPWYGMVADLEYRARVAHSTYMVNMIEHCKYRQVVCTEQCEHTNAQQMNYYRDQQTMVNTVKYGQAMFANQ